MPDDSKAEQLAQMFLEQASQHAVILLSPEGHVVGWRGDSTALFGYTADEIIGESVAKLFTPEDVRLGVHSFELFVARNDDRADDDRWMMRKDGAQFWATGVVTPLKNPDGEIVGYSKVLRDGTNLKGHIQSLESQVHDLATAARRKNIFLGAVAHELGNTFASVQMMVAMSQREDADLQALRDVLQMVSGNLGLTRRLIEDVKDMAHLRAGELHLQKSRVYLNDIAARAGDAARASMLERQQHFNVLLPPYWIVVNADATRLEQVISNLLINANKYTPEGGSVTLRIGNEGDEAFIKVEDTGVGIDPKMMPRLFDLFSREHRPGTARPGGLGLGLWIVKRLVTLHDGTIAVRSGGRDKGSEFVVRLPLLDVLPKSV